MEQQSRLPAIAHSLPVRAAPAISAWKIAGFCLVVWAIHLAILLPKPIHIDDLPYLEGAEQVLRHPLHPNCNQFNWIETSRITYRDNLNPPGWNYVEAAWIAIFGRSVPALRFLASFVVLAATFASFVVANRFTRHPFLATALFILSPTLLPSVNNMMDLPATALGLAAIAAFLRGVDRSSMRAALIGGLLAAAAVMTKYNMIVLVPLLAFYAVLAGRRRFAWFAALPVGVLALWAVHNYFFFENHEIHLLLTSGYKPFQKSWLQHFFSLGTVYGSSFLFLGVAFLPGISKRGLLRAAPAALLGLAWIFGPALFMPNWASPENHTRIEYLVFATNSALLLIFSLARFRIEPVDTTPEARSEIFLWSWFLAVVGFQFCFAFHNSPRYHFLAFPPLAMLLVRGLERASPQWSFPARVVGWGSIAAQLILGIALARADLAHAAANRDYPTYVAENYGGSGARIFHFGHWGLQYYCGKLGIPCFDTKNWDIRPGDLFIVARQNPNENLIPSLSRQTPDGRIEFDPRMFRLKEAPRDYPNPSPFVTNREGRAWMYAVVVPNMPYAWNGERAPAETFLLLEAIKSATSERSH